MNITSYFMNFYDVGAGIDRTREVELRLQHG